MKRRQVAPGCLAVSLIFTPLLLLAESPSDRRVQADAHCVAAKNSAREAADQDRRAKELDRQAQALAQDLFRSDAQVRQLEQEARERTSP